MTEEIELTQIPSQGLRSYYKTQAQRDMGMKFWQTKQMNGKFMEVQPWRCEWNGITYFGFSYNHKYHLSKRQLAEFITLRKVK